MRIAIKRPLAVALLIACALVTVGAGEEGTAMLEEFNRLLNILISPAGGPVPWHDCCPAGGVPAAGAAAAGAVPCGQTPGRAAQGR